MTEHEIAERREIAVRLLFPGSAPIESPMGTVLGVLFILICTVIAVC